MKIKKQIWLIKKMSKKILIVYYSLTGNTKYIAECIKEAVDADIQPIKPIKEIDPKGTMKFLWGGMQALMKNNPNLFPIEKEPKDYDLIFLGTPVWAWTFSPPIRAFIEQYDLSGKKIAIWCCSGGGPGKTLEKLKRAIKNAQILGEIDFVEPLTNKKEIAQQQVKSWAKEITNKLN